MLTLGILLAYLRPITYCLFYVCLQTGIFMLWISTYNVLPKHKDTGPPWFPDLLHLLSLFLREYQNVNQAMNGDRVRAFQVLLAVVLVVFVWERFSCFLGIPPIYIQYQLFFLQS